MPPSNLKDKLAALPAKPGVYLFKNKSGEIIYIGKAKSLRKRVASYFKPQPDLKTTILLDRLYDIDYVVAGSEMDALVLEDDLIKKYKPRYNVAQRDDKTYPYLKLTVNEAWPRLLMVRRKDKDGALYFGRFQGGMVRSIIRLVKKLFPIRWCKETPLKMREQPCLYYRIGSCSGPCLGNVRREDYQVLIDGIVLLLKGKIDAAREKIRTEMDKASKRLDYERAAYYRDSLQALERMPEAKRLSCSPAPRLLAAVIDLQKELKLPKMPLRIEAFDVSNIQGSNIVGAMVAFLGGLPLKSDYRRFKVHSTGQKSNDVQALYEIVKRRYAKTLAQKMAPPDLVLVDGGLAQVNFGEKALAEAMLDRPIIGLAKKAEEIYFPGRAATLRLPRESAALQLLQRVRDEAHRFAVGYHRLRRGKAFFS